MSESKKGLTISSNSNIRSSISFTLSSPNGANGLLSLTRRRLSIPAVSPYPKIEADKVRASCSSVSPVSASQADSPDVYRKLHSVLYQAARGGAGAPKGTRTNLGFTSPHKEGARVGGLVGVATRTLRGSLGIKGDSVIRPAAYLLNHTVWRQAAASQVPVREKVTI